MRSRFVAAVGAGCLTLFTLVLAAQQGQTPPTQTPPATVQSGQGRGAGTGPVGQFQGRGGRGGGPVTIKAARVLDGRGNVMNDAIITVQGSKIVSITQEAPANPIDYDLHDATVLPGLIDVHVHLNWYFGPDGH